MNAANPTQKLIAALVLAAAGAGSAQAAPGEPTRAAPNGAFVRMDENRDGYVSPAEAKKHGMLTAAFKEGDDNRDGRLDSDEFIKAASVDERKKVVKYVDDSVITAKVKAELLKDSLVKGVRVGVETYNGTVQLSGFVDNEQQAAKAEEIAAGVSGVRKVINNLIVKG